MAKRFMIAVSVLFIVYSCHHYSNEDYMLDPGIPGLETPHEHIATIRTKWLNEKLIETAFLDQKDRVLEVFRFGRSSEKKLQQYEGGNNVLTVTFHHSDSDPMGRVSVDSLWRGYDANGMLKTEKFINTGLIDGQPTNKVNYFRYRKFAYTKQGDTLVKQYPKKETRSNHDIDRNEWTWNNDSHLIQHDRLNVWMSSSQKKDTMHHFSKSFSYDSVGRMAMAWYGYMYLWEFYGPEGPDTTWYSYGERGRLVKELRRYTTDMSNKGAPDTTGRSAAGKEILEWSRQRFLVGDKIFHNNDKTDMIRYQYEIFDSKNHLPLQIPPLD